MFCIMNNNTNAYFKLDLFPTLNGVHKDYALMLDNLNILTNGRDPGNCRGMSLQNPWLVPHCCQSPLHARATQKTLLHTVRALGAEMPWPELAKGSEPYESIEDYQHKLTYTKTPTSYSNSFNSPTLKTII